MLAIGQMIYLILQVKHIQLRIRCFQLAKRKLVLWKLFERQLNWIWSFIISKWELIQRSIFKQLNKWIRYSPFIY